MENSKSFVVVTGGAKGIGRDVSCALAEAGHDIVLAARDKVALRHVACEIERLGRRAVPVETDVTSASQVERMILYAIETLGPNIHGLVNVAGVPGPIETPVQDVDPLAFQAVMEINVTGVFLPIKYVTPFLIARGQGKIINIGSNSGTAGYPNRVGYAASKWAVRGLTKTVAIELGAHNINVNCVNPGIVDGPRMALLCRERAAERGIPEEMIRNEYLQAQSLKRVTSSLDVANAVVFLASEAARNITGQDIDVDGGWGI